MCIYTIYIYSVVGLLPLRMSVPTMTPGDQKYHNWFPWNGLIPLKWPDTIALVTSGEPVLGAQEKGQLAWRVSDKFGLKNEWFKVVWYEGCALRETVICQTS